MISFALTEEQSMAREAMGEFARDVLRPQARECDEASAISDALLEEAWQLGLTSTAIPEALGGAGERRSPVMNALILEALAYGDATLALAAASPSLFATPLLEFGTEAQQAKYLPPFCEENFYPSSLALVEPGPCFEPLKPRTKALARRDVYVLSGAKSFVPLGSCARHFLVVAAEEGGGANAGRVSVFIVPRDASGLEITGPEKNLGLRALDTHTLTLNEVEVPAADRLGGAAGCDIRRLISAGRAAQAAIMTGLAQAVLDECVPYAKERIAFGEPIARKQAIAFLLADMKIETDAVRWMTWKAASELEKSLAGGPQTKSPDFVRSAALGRSYAAEQVMKIADDGVQVFGGHGYIRDYPLEMWFRNARTLGVLEGVAIV